MVISWHVTRIWEHVISITQTAVRLWLLLLYTHILWNGSYTSFFNYVELIFTNNKCIYCRYLYFLLSCSLSLCPPQIQIASLELAKDKSITKRFRKLCTQNSHLHGLPNYFPTVHCYALLLHEWDRILGWTTFHELEDVCVCSTRASSADWIDCWLTPRTRNTTSAPSIEFRRVVLLIVLPHLSTFRMISIARWLNYSFKMNQSIGLLLLERPIVSISFCR